MFKLTSLIGTILIFLSCGQNKDIKSPTVPLDSSSLITDQAIDTSAKNMPGPITDEAHNEDINNIPPYLIDFVPEGYTALNTTPGDLNLDEFTDIILVLKKKGEDTTSDVTEHPEKRPLLILIGREDGTFKLAAKSDNAVYCIDCGGLLGDPFMYVVIKKGYFSVEHGGGSAWRWTRTITFKYSPTEKNWFLHKDGHGSFNSNEPAKIETKIYTTKDFGKVPFDKFDIYKQD